MAQIVGVLVLLGGFVWWKLRDGDHKEALLKEYGALITAFCECKDKGCRVAASAKLGDFTETNKDVEFVGPKGDRTTGDMSSALGDLEAWERKFEACQQAALLEEAIDTGGKRIPGLTEDNRSVDEKLEELKKAFPQSAKDGAK